MPIRTPRLDLIPGTRAHLEAELESRGALAALLDAEVPESWPPLLYDSDAIGWMLERMADDTSFERWGFRYFVLREDASPRAVGAGLE